MRRQQVVLHMMVSGVVALAVGAGAGAAAATPAQAPAPIRPTAAGTHRTAAIDTAHDRVVIVMQGRDLNTWARSRGAEATFAQKVNTLADRGMPLTGINVYDWTGNSTPLTISGNTYATWPQLTDLVQSRGGALASEGRNHQQLSTMTPAERWNDTCGLQSDYRARGLNVSGMYAYAGGPFQAEYQRTLVSQCFAFGRKYGTRVNTMSKLAAPWLLNVWSLNGGCAKGAGTCFGKQPPQRYTTPETLLTGLTPNKGQVAVLQIYHLLTGKGSTWDCTSAAHQTARTEDYCLEDVLAFLDGLPADIRFATIDDLAAAVGRGPGQLPGVTLGDYLRRT